MKRVLATIVLLCSGCGSTPGVAPDDLAVADLAVAARDLRAVPDGRGVDSDPGPDLARPADLGVPGVLDLAIPSDLAAMESDLAVPAGDMARALARCPATQGYGGVQMPPQLPPCGQQGSCNGSDYTLDCDGMVCICALDKIEIARFIQMQATCNKLDDPWASICGF